MKHDNNNNNKNKRDEEEYLMQYFLKEKKTLREYVREKKIESVEGRTLLAMINQKIIDIIISEKIEKLPRHIRNQVNSLKKAPIMRLIYENMDSILDNKKKNKKDEIRECVVKDYIKIMYRLYGWNREGEEEGKMWGCGMVKSAKCKGPNFSNKEWKNPKNDPYWHMNKVCCSNLHWKSQHDKTRDAMCRRLKRMRIRYEWEPLYEKGKGDTDNRADILIMLNSNTPYQWLDITFTNTLTRPTVKPITTMINAYLRKVRLSGKNGRGSKIVKAKNQVLGPVVFSQYGILLEGIYKPKEREEEYNHLLDIGEAERLWKEQAIRNGITSDEYRFAKKQTEKAISNQIAKNVVKRAKTLQFGEYKMTGLGNEIE